MPVRSLASAMSFTWALVYSCQGVLQVSRRAAQRSTAQAAQHSTASSCAVQRAIGASARCLCWRGSKPAQAGGRIQLQRGALQVFSESTPAASTHPQTFADCRVVLAALRRVQAVLAEGPPDPYLAGWEGRGALGTCRSSGAAAAAENGSARPPDVHAGDRGSAGGGGSSGGAAYSAAGAGEAGAAELEEALRGDLELRWAGGCLPVPRSLTTTLGC